MQNQQTINLQNKPQNQQMDNRWHSVSTFNSGSPSVCAVDATCLWNNRIGRHRLDIPNFAGIDSCLC